LSAGTVHLYILAPDGHCIDSQHVATATKVDKLTAMLERTVDRLKTPAGKPLVTPACQCTAPKAGKDDLVLHLVARNVRRQGNEDVPARPKLGETRSAGWGSYPAENWIVLSKELWQRLLPGKVPGLGSSWELDRTAAARILNHVYPSTENNDIRTNRIDRQELKATVLSNKDGVLRCRLDGRLRMKHPFYHKDDGNFVDTRMVGILELDAEARRIRSLQLATQQAMYGRIAFGVAVQSVR
jgi:hypothetical protein